jgi:hypothetical protein
VRGFLADDDPDWETPPQHDNWILWFIHSRPDGLKNPDPNNPINDDALRILQSRNVIVDHCSFARAEDECVQISEANNLTIQNCIFAETPGDHSYFGGMLVNYTRPDFSLDSLSIHHNIWNRIEGRLPELSRESPSAPRIYLNIELSCNAMWDNLNYIQIASNTGQLEPQQPIYYKMNMVNNLMYPRSSYTSGMVEDAVLRDTSSAPRNLLYVSGNKLNRFPNYSDYQLFYCCNDFDQFGPSTDSILAQRLTQRHPFPSITYTRTDDILDYVYANAGCFPRDPMDRRLMEPIRLRRIDTTSTSNPAAMANDAFTFRFNSANPPQPPTDTDGDGMPDYWESRNGLNPIVQDHNGTQLSVRYTGVAGYTNLECYLNALADSLIKGTPTLITDVKGFNDTAVPPSFKLWQNSPNPFNASTNIMFSLPKRTHVRLTVGNILGQTVATLIDEIREAGAHRITWNANNLPSGMYFYRLHTAEYGETKKLVLLK